MGWLRETADDLYADLPSYEISQAITILDDFEKELNNEMEKINDLEDDKKRRSYRTNLVCELAVVYRKQAELHLRSEDLDGYYQLLEKSKAEFEKCLQLKKS